MRMALFQTRLFAAATTTGTQRAPTWLNNHRIQKAIVRRTSAPFTTTGVSSSSLAIVEIGKTGGDGASHEKARSTPFLVATAIAAAAAAVGTTTTKAACEEKNDDNNSAENPLWPSGVSSDMVDRYVESLIANPDINISTIPDGVERVLYASTVRITLNAVYQAISNLHGVEFMGHTLQLSRTAPPTTAPSTLLLTAINNNVDAINVQKLDELADSLLATNTVNSKLVPDIIEKQVYVNCLRLVFTLLEAVSETLSIDLCGHELRLSVQPTPENLAIAIEQQQQQQQDSGSMQGVSIDNDVLDKLVNDTVADSLGDGDDELSILQQISPYRLFLKALHRELFGLILGIADNVLSQTELILLEDCIKISLSPMPKANKKKNEGAKKAKMDTRASSNEKKQDDDATTATTTNQKEVSESLEIKLQTLKSQKEKAQQEARTAKLIAAATTTTSLALVGFAVLTNNKRS